MGASPNSHAAVVGARWSAIDVLFVRAMSAIAQLAYGYLLSPNDFGLYGLALSVTFFVRVYQDGGVRELLISADTDELDQTRSACFTVALTTNVGLAISLALIAPPVAEAYSEPHMVRLMNLVGLSLVANSGWAVANGSLRRDLRFRSLAKINLLASFLQYFVPLALLQVGVGVEALIWGLIASNIARTALGLHQLSEPVALAPLGRSWGLLRSRSGWLLGGTFFVALMTQGDYFVLGFYFETAALGVYFFAYQLANQAFFLVATSFQNVAAPYLAAKQRADTADGGQLLLIALATYCASVAVGTATMGLAMAANSLIWARKWTEAMPVVAVFVLALPLFIQYTVLRVLLLAEGRFREWATWAAGPAIALPLVAWFCALLGLSIAQCAVVIAALLGGTGVALASAAWRDLGVPVATYLARLSRLVAVALTAAAATCLPVLASGSWHPAAGWSALGAAIGLTVLASGMMVVDRGVFRLTASVLPLESVTERIRNLA